MSVWAVVLPSPLKDVLDLSPNGLSGLNIFPAVEGGFGKYSFGGIGYKILSKFCFEIEAEIALL